MDTAGRALSGGSDGPDRIYLSPPHMSGEERELLDEAFASNWIAPLGPHVDAFEAEFASRVGAANAVALASGTAAMHLALRLAGVGPDDEILVPSLTFVGCVNPIRYLGARPVFVDSEPAHWNVDPTLVERVIEDRIRRGLPLPAAVVPVHLYGHPADLEPILRVCGEHGIPVVEDAAESLGALYHDRSPGTWGEFGIFSFNGNKIVTTSGGGMLITEDEASAVRARKLASQARDPAPHYEHSELGYNYRLSNLLAAVGRAQLRVLEDRVRRRREVFRHYVESLGDLPGLTFQTEASWARHTRWLTCLLVDEERFGCTPAEIRLALEAENIEARPLWKPMHLQPLYRACEMHGGEVAEDLFRRGLCLPSGSSLSEGDVERIAAAIRGLHERSTV